MAAASDENNNLLTNEPSSGTPSKLKIPNTNNNNKIANIMVGLLCGLFIGSYSSDGNSAVGNNSDMYLRNTNSSLISSSESYSMSSLDFTLLDIPSSVKEIVINVGSNLDPLLPSKEMGPCAHTIAIEPIVGCKIPEHRQLSVINAAISSTVRRYFCTLLYLTFNH